MNFRVDPAKVRDYLLTTSPLATPEAHGKSRFFHAIGYAAEHWTVLRDDRLQHPVTANLLTTAPSRYGRKQIFQCSMPVAPNGRVYCLRTVWTQRPDGELWLSTAFPRQPER
ncbi:MAG: DUF6883 domain-containing protein [Rhodopila sp.]